MREPAFAALSRSLREPVWLLPPIREASFSARPFIQGRRPQTGQAVPRLGAHTSRPRLKFYRRCRPVELPTFTNCC